MIAIYYIENEMEKAGRESLIPQPQKIHELTLAQEMLLARIRITTVTTSTTAATTTTSSTTPKLEGELRWLITPGLMTKKRIISNSKPKGRFQSLSTSYRFTLTWFTV